MSAVCEQIIDCCPPTPFDYLIHEAIYYNAQQCATVACPGQDPTIPPNQGLICDEGGNPILDENGNPMLAEGSPGPRLVKYCVDAGRVVSDSQSSADQEAAALALQIATRILTYTTQCGFQSQAWCCVITCNPGACPDEVLLDEQGNPILDENGNPILAELTPTVVFTQTNDSVGCLDNLGFNKGAAWIGPTIWPQAANRDQADKLSQDAVQSAALRSVTCIFQNDDTSALADCPAGTPVCQTTQPTPTNNQVFGFVPKNTGNYNSTISKCDANNKACAAAKIAANLALSGCSIAGQLKQLLWYMPCSSGYPVPSTCYCSDPNPQNHATLTGTPGKSYSVRLRIRGAVELKDYYGADVGVPGGDPSDIIPGTKDFARLWPNPNDPTIPYPIPFPFSSYPFANHYSLKIYDNDPFANPGISPVAIYYLNNLSSPNGLHSTVQAHVYAMDYFINLVMKTGQTIVLEALSIEQLEFDASFFEVKVPDDGNPPLNPIINQGSKGFYGQFLQMDAVSVVMI